MREDFSYAVTAPLPSEVTELEQPTWLSSNFHNVTAPLPTTAEGADALNRVNTWSYNYTIVPDAIMNSLIALAQGTDPYGQPMSAAERGVHAQDIILTVASLSQFTRDLANWCNTEAIPWISNATEVARRYTEQHGGCNAGKSQFLQDMHMESPNRDFEVTVTAYQTVTVSASSVEEAQDMAADALSNYDWNTDDSYNWTVEEQ